MANTFVEHTKLKNQGYNHLKPKKDNPKKKQNVEMVVSDKSGY
jgi:hypothetical protein